MVRSVLLDQRLLPHQTVYLTCTSDAEVAVAIRDMAVRGAPAIGVAAAYAIVLAAGHHQADLETQQRALRSADALLRAARPTAVNLTWALDRMQQRWQSAWNCSPSAVYVALLAESAGHRRGGHSRQPPNRVERAAADTRRCRASSITATPAAWRRSTMALRWASFARRTSMASACTFTWMKHARACKGRGLTAWELAQLGISHTVVVDGAAGYLMQNVGVDLLRGGM